MAFEQQAGKGFQAFEQPRPRSSEALPIDGLDVSSASDSSNLGLQKGCPAAAGFDDRILHINKSNARPRLPSFRGLGLSSFDLPTTHDSHTDGTTHSVLKRTLEDSGSGPGATLCTRASPHRTGSTPLLTPPAEIDSTKWNIGPRARHTSPNSSKPTTTVPIPIEYFPSGSIGTSLAGDGGPVENLSFKSSQTSGNDSHQEPANNNTSESSLQSTGSNTWLDLSVDFPVRSIDPSNLSSNLIQIVSQTLPNPAKESCRPNAIFTEVIAAIQTRFGTSPQPYITITHAVPPRFDLLNLPSSPPSTPNLFVGQDDYFTQSIFAHAAVVPSYHLVNSNLATPVPSSPNPIVPPSSVQVSVLERYIPPSSAQEGQELFSLSGQSVLIDRLTELSPDGGSMLFVYPTRAGASTFTRKYLGQVLDPLLRALVEVHQLSYGLAESLGGMAAVPDMHGFDALKAKTISLCRRMSHRITSDTKRSKFHLVYASTGEVTVDRRTWTKWYLTQEHARFKRILETYWGRGKRLSQLESASAGTVLREFIDGVDKMTNEEAEQVGPGIELGVFVIRRTLAASSG